MKRRHGLMLACLLLGSGCRVDSYCLDCDTDAAVAGDGATPPIDRDAGDAASGGGGGGGAGSAGGSGGGGGAAGQEGLGCTPSSAGEACNHIDDDCDGTVDEDFDLQTNPYHCGECEHACEIENADAACHDGVCELTACLPGFVDLDGELGCEYRCPAFPAHAETCNGLDDDCDTRIDEELDDPPSGLCRTTPGTPCEGVTPVCDERAGVTRWYCNYPSSVEFNPVVPNGIATDEARCDGLDGDCDGIADDPWPSIGTPCWDDGLGACADGGAISCDPDDDTRVICNLALPPDPLPGSGEDAEELCNGIDDNCDGIVDNSSPADPHRIRDDMVKITVAGPSFWIYRHEASRPDATDDDPGISAARACSSAHVLPWNLVSFDSAAAACVAAGHRLCTADEWQAACEGEAANDYPYGPVYVAGACNGADRDAVPGGPIDSRLEPTRELALCVSDDGVLDMSGNLKEWTDDKPGVEPIYVVRGGSYESPEFGLTCQTDLSRATGATVLSTLGFRCCDSDGP